MGIFHAFWQWIGFSHRTVCVLDFQQQFYLYSTAVAYWLNVINRILFFSSTDGPQGSGPKGGILCGQFPQKSEGKELKILVQPETQHRARYLTEGSRGSVKDRTQQGFPTVKVSCATTLIYQPVLIKSTQHTHITNTTHTPTYAIDTFSHTYTVKCQSFFTCVFYVFKSCH